jgi:hypothetical protein
MKTITVPPHARALNALLEQASGQNLVLRTRDGREFVLAEIDDFDREIELTRQNKQLMRLLDSRGRERATISLAEARLRSRVARPRKTM